MTTYNALVDLTKQPLPAQIGQRRITTFFSNTPGDSVVPYPYWVRNAVPFAKGLRSVSWAAVADIPQIPVSGSPAKLYYFPVVGAGYQLGAYANNNFFLFDLNTMTWGAPVACTPAYDDVPTTAFVQGQSLVFLPGVGLRKVTANGLEAVTLKWGDGVTPPTDIIGCSACQGYLVLFSRSRIYYSSPTNYTTFSISEGGVSTGAGSTNIQGLAGAIVNVAAISGGAIVYASQNAASMRYTGNPLLPFAFNLIIGFPGVVKERHIGSEPNNQYHFVWTVRGLHRVDSTMSQPILNEITESISRDLLAKTDGVDVVNTPCPLDVRLSLIGVDELCISVGERGKHFDYGWVLNLSMGRLGRIDIPHWDFHTVIPLAPITAMTMESLLAKNLSYAALRLFSYGTLTGDISQSSEKPLEFQVLGVDGNIYLSDWGNPSASADSEVLIGDFTLSLGTMVEINKVLLRSTSETKVTIRSNYGREVEFVDYNGTGEFLGRVTGKSLTLKVSGEFELTDVQITMTQAGAS